MKCEYCDIVQGIGKSQILFQDSEVVIAIRDHVLTPGQITVFPKTHYTIMELVPNKIIGKCAMLANKVSIAVFDGLASQGTNVLVQNGLGAGQNVPHFGIDIVPRIENDAVNLQWEPTQLEEVTRDMIFEELKKDAPKFVKEGLEGKQEIITKEGDTEIDVEEQKDNYLLKSLKRIP
jgi:diadenosine tetraphosphate (Ap4A) HIT family hydrolase